MRMITLRVPDGEAYSYPISFGVRRFSPYRLDITDPNSPWLVNVTPEAADHFIHNGGFSMFDQRPFGPMDFVPTTYVRHPDGHGCGWQGMAYLPDGDGLCFVPAAAVADLEPHGHKPVPPAELAEIMSRREAAKAVSAEPARKEAAKPEAFKKP